MLVILTTSAYMLLREANGMLVFRLGWKCMTTSCLLHCDELIIGFLDPKILGPCLANTDR